MIDPGTNLICVLLFVGSKLSPIFFSTTIVPQGTWQWTKVFGNSTWVEWIDAGPHVLRKTCSSAHHWKARCNSERSARLGLLPKMMWNWDPKQTWQISESYQDGKVYNLPIQKKLVAWDSGHPWPEFLASNFCFSAKLMFLKTWKVAILLNPSLSGSPRLNNESLEMMMTTKYYRWQMQYQWMQERYFFFNTTSFCCHVVFVIPFSSPFFVACTITSKGIMASSWTLYGNLVSW